MIKRILFFLFCFIFIPSLSFSQSKKISEMPNATTLSGSELIPIVQGGNNVKTTTGNIAGLAALACGDLTNDGTACLENTGTSGHTLPFLDGTNEFSGQQTFNSVQGSIGNSGTVISGTTYTFVTGDCGTTVVFTSSSEVTATIPASIVPASKVCSFAVLQAGNGKILLNGSAVSPANLISEFSYTGTSGTLGNMIGLTLLTVSASANAYLTGAGS